MGLRSRVMSFDSIAGVFSAVLPACEGARFSGQDNAVSAKLGWTPSNYIARPILVLQTHKTNDVTVRIHFSVTTIKWSSN